MPGMISSDDTRQLNRIAASGINEKIRNLRARSGVETILRRLLWELVQNAKDNAVISNNSCDAKVDIRIKLTEEAFVFSHNNGFFKVENIQGIIRRFSSEDKEGLETTNSELLDCITGRFGTGFMTTHLLSEIVKVSGLFKDPTGKFREFDLELDRSGKTLKEFENAINRSVEIFEEKIEKAPFVNFKGEDSWTSFHYELTDDGYDLAKRAIDGLMESLGYVLINLPLINTISIENAGEVQTFKLKELDHQNPGDLIIKKIQSNDSQFNNQGFVQKYGDDLCVIIPVQFDDDQQIAPIRIHQNQPRLFLDFPLIGSEALQIPYVINSHQFEPTEPRDGIFLADSDDEDTTKNKELIEHSARLYLELARELSGLEQSHSLYSLVAYGKTEEEDWLSIDWFQEEIVQFCLSELLKIPLVDTNNKQRKSIKKQKNADQVYFPYHAKEEVAQQIWKLSNDLWPESLPQESDSLKWAEVIWNDCLKQNMRILTADIQNEKSLNKLSEKLGISEKETIRWLNKYYDLLFFEGSFISRVKDSEFAVIPSRTGEFKKPEELKECQKLDDQIIEICEQLDYNINSVLVYKKLETNDTYRDQNPKSILYPTLTLEKVASEINDRLQSHSNAREALNDLLSLFSEDKKFPKENDFIYQASKDLLENEIPEKKIIKNWISEFWDYACNARVNLLVRVISEYESLDDFDELTKTREIENAKKWLVHFTKSLVDLNYKDRLNNEEDSIVPNQNGIFQNLEALFGEAEELDESLLDISAKLGEDFRKDLIDRDFDFLEIPDSRIYDQSDVADAIVKAIRPLTEETPRTEQTAEIFMSLLEWFDNHSELAEELFPSLYENQHHLYSAEQVKKWRDKYQEYHKKDEELNALLVEHNIEDIHELKEKLSQLKTQPIREIKEGIITDRAGLLAAGIYSENEGKRFNKHSRHLRFLKGNYSTDDYAYVKAILKRAVKNVLKHLQQDERYEFLDDVSTIMISTETLTVISGVKKNGQHINLVIRPSDGQKVHVFYGAEFTALKRMDTEFWIDNGVDIPENLTIGKILDYTGTEVIPLYRIAEN